MDPASGRAYWYNQQLGLSQWEPPAKRRRTMGLDRAGREAKAEALRKAAYNGSIPKVEAALAGLSTVERLLVVDGLDPEDGYAPLHLATIQGHLQTAERLVKARADVDVASHTGDTPLMWAAHQGKLPMLKLLLRLGADCLLKNHLGRTASVQARGSKHVRIYEMLDNREADVQLGLSRKAASAMKAAAGRRAENAARVSRAEAGAQPRAEEEPRAVGASGGLSAHYRVLGLEEEAATVEEVRKAYKQLALNSEAPS